MTLSRKFVQVVADAYTVFILMLSTDAFLAVLLSGNGPTDGSKGSHAMRASWGLIYAITLLSFIGRRNEGIAQIWASIRANKSLAFLVLLTLISSLWSIDRSITIHAAVNLLLSALVGIDLSYRYTLARQIRLWFIASALLIGMSVFLELFIPGFIPRSHYEGQAWHGVFANKNQLGRVTAFGVAACLALPHRLRWTKGAAIASGLLLGVLARSAGAVGYLAVIVGIFMWLSVLKWTPKQRKVAMTASATIALLMIFFVSLNLPQVTTLIGKDPTLTGRTWLWQMSLEAIQKQPLLGYGYQAFWSDNSPSANLLREELNWDAPHAHNGYIDLGLGLGLVGLGAYSMVVFTMARRGYLFFMNGEESWRKWPLTFLVLASAYQLTESGIVSGDTAQWILLCCLVCSLSPTQDEPVLPRSATRELLAG